MVVGPLTFLAPLALFGLLVLPIIWWILRITPPKPQEQVFPPLRLLIDVNKEEETPRSTPFWLLMFRLTLGALVAIALANPILFKQSQDTTKPVVLVIDNGWAAAGHWPDIVREAESFAKQAVSENQMTAVLISIDPRENNAKGFVPAAEALKYIRSLQPLAFEPERIKLAEDLGKIDMSGADVFWLADGLDYGYTDALRTSLKTADVQKIFLPNSEIAPLLAGKTEETANGFRSVWHRADTASLRNLTIAAYGPQGRVIARAPANFTPGDTIAEANFELPAQLRNQASQLRAEGHNSAGSVVLLDDSWGRPLVGLLKGSDENTQPLLSEWHFIEKALAPNADIFKGDLDTLLAVSPSMIFMTDRARTESPDLQKYVEDGGLLVRFAGPKLAKRTDELLPVPLRKGGRDLGGALAWEEPQGFAAFTEDSPFFGLSIAEDVTVKKQVMARPGAETDAATWARLKDGAPIITSTPQGLGRVVLFHVTAGPDWSSLPLSGLYVHMLKRILPLARASTAKPSNSGGDWTAERTLDGYGQLGAPPPGAAPIANAAFAATTASRQNPPGLYRQGSRRQALNTVTKPESYKVLAPQSLSKAAYGGRKPKSLSGILLGIAALMLAFDVLLSLIASGRLRGNAWKKATVSLIAAMIFITLPNNTHAQEYTENDALGLHLAYVFIGNGEVDSMSRVGLEGLVFELDRRTTIEPVGVRGINLETDTLAYYPFLYWPVMRDAPALPPKVSAKLNAYMAAGGTIVFDTQDADRQKLLGADTHPGLAQISKSLDIPRLVQSSKDHVITKSFYLLQNFPGRYGTGKIWVEADGRGSARDGVSSVIVGSSDWSAAWAKDEKGRTLVVIEDEIQRQREFSYRFGVNLTMYALSGNYKADQVHVAALVERLGQQEGDGNE